MATRGRPKKTNTKSSPDFLEKISRETQSNQSRLSMILGGLIILVIVVLIFNYFNKPKAELGPAQQTQANAQHDVTPDNLPGKYTVKDGDTLFTIADAYYKDGYQYPVIAQTNNIANPDLLEAGQVLTIPKLPASAMQENPGQDQSSLPQEQVTTDNSNTPNNATTWGPTIQGDSYTVTAGDWLSTIAGRAYGDVMSYQKIADANGITDPNVIEVGTVLKIPR